MPNDDRVAFVVDHFQEEILNGHLSPGDRLPPEREVSRRFNVSRGVVREAFGSLECMGMLERRQGSGTRVTVPSTSSVTVGYQRLLRCGGIRQSDLEATRFPLECAMARLAALHRTEEHLERMRQTQEVLRDAGRSLAEHVRSDIEFHDTIAVASGNPVFKLVLDPIHELLVDTRRQTLQFYGIKRAHDTHACVLEAIEQQDEDAAEAAMRHHLPRITGEQSFVPMD